MKSHQTFFTCLLAISVFLSFLLTAFLILPAIDQNSSGEYCTLIEEGSKEVANWTSQGRPCALKWNVFYESLVSLLIISVLLFLLLLIPSSLIIPFLKSSDKEK